MSDDGNRTILREVASYYMRKLDRHGVTPQGVDWNGIESHELRHRQFDRLLDGDPAASVIDLGCGYGDFLRYLRANGHTGRFTGYDVAETMIEAARAVHGEGLDRQWHVGAEPAEPADYAIASGIFNVRGCLPVNDWTRYVERTIDLLARSSTRGFAFNVLSLSSDPERRQSYLHYADPAATLAHCLARFGRSVALLQDYGLYEFTVVIRK